MFNSSDRDILHNNKNIKDFLDQIFTEFYTNNYKNFQPDLVVLGHADNVTNETLDEIKKDKTLMCQWFLDPVGKYGPDYKIIKIEF